MKRLLIYFLVGLPFAALADFVPTHPLNFVWICGWAGLATAQGVYEYLSPIKDSV